MAFVAGHFGEWLQGRLGPDGPVALITLPVPDRGATARYERGGPLILRGGEWGVTTEMLGDLLARLELPVAGRFALETDFPSGGGTGMSTAALMALAKAAGAQEKGLVAACLAVEGASDPLLEPVPDAILWAPREARVLHPVRQPFQADILAGFWGSPLRTDPLDTSFPGVTDLIEAWEATQHLAEQAILASASATRCTTLRGPAGDPTAALAEATGAVGWTRAHTGSARALIFEPGTVPANAENEMNEAGYERVFAFRTGRKP